MLSTYFLPFGKKLIISQQLPRPPMLQALTEELLRANKKFHIDKWI
jgi:hypothetical protein